MIAKLLGGMFNLAVYFSAATMIATIIMLCHFWSAWNMDRGRLVQMLAIAQGLDLFQAQAEDEEGPRDVSAEQPHRRHPPHRGRAGELAAYTPNVILSGASVSERSRRI